MIVIKPHAESRMSDRRITRNQIHKVLQNPREIISVRYGRLAAYSEVDKGKLVVIYEKKDEVIEVVTALWVDEKRLKRLGFTGI